MMLGRPQLFQWFVIEVSAELVADAQLNLIDIGAHIAIEDRWNAADPAHAVTLIVELDPLVFESNDPVPCQGVLNTTTQEPPVMSRRGVGDRPGIRWRGYANTTESDLRIDMAYGVPTGHVEQPTAPRRPTHATTDGID